MKFSFILFLLVLIFGCASGRVDIYSQGGEFIGACTADFNWHWYGAQDSVDYLLYICAKEHDKNGKVISDTSILKKDFGLPLPPKGQSWNKQNAYEGFKSGHFSEQKYGYILAAIEYEFMMRKQKAREQLDSEAITQAQYKHLIQEAEVLFNGR